MKRYFFVASSLPDLNVGSPPELSFSAFMFLCSVNLRKKDYEKTEVIRRYYDLENLRLMWEKDSLDESLEEELDYRGNLDENALEEALIMDMGLPKYVYDYLEKYDSRQDRLYHFPGLIADYFRKETEHAKGFLRNYLVFEHDWRLVMAGLRSKQQRRDIAKELQYEDLEDILVRQLLAQRDSQHYDPPEQYEDLKRIFEEHQGNPIELQLAVCRYRFAKIEEMLGTDMFSMDRVLGYMAQLIIVEQWVELDKKKGLQIIDTIVKEAS